MTARTGFVSDRPELQTMVSVWAQPLPEGGIGGTG